MQSTPAVAAVAEADTVPFRIDPLDNLDIENIVLSPCGTRIESFDCDGAHFVIDWEELAPPGAEDDDEEGTPHEEFMAELDRRVDEWLARRGAER